MDDDTKANRRLHRAAFDFDEIDCIGLANDDPRHQGHANAAFDQANDGLQMAGIFGNSRHEPGCLAGHQSHYV